jgi:prolyl oligopeptidase
MADRTIPLPPPTRREDCRETIHGVEVADPYRWLEDQEAPETREWIAAQNAYTRSVLDRLPGREALSARLDELTRTSFVGIPSVRDGRYFYYRRDREQEHPVYCARTGAEGEERVLLDPHTMSADLSVTVDVSCVSEDGTVLIYGLRHAGEDEVLFHTLDVDTGAVRELGLPKARYFGIVLTHDKRTLYYVRYHPEGPRAYRRDLDAPGEGEMVFGDGLDPRKGIGLEISEDGRWLIATVWYGAGARQSDVYLKDLTVDGPFVTVVDGVEASFSATVLDGTLYLQTDWEAPRGRVLTADLADLGRDRWCELIPERESTLSGLSAAGGKLFLAYLEDVVPAIRVFAPDGTETGALEAPGLGSLFGVYGRWARDEAFYAFQSFCTPQTAYRMSVATGEATVWARHEVPVASDDFEVRQLWCTSRDGTRVPMFVCHRKGLTRDGRRPTLLTAYGGFGAALTPAFQARAVLMAERDGILVVANLRGGSEFGDDWHAAGQRERKQNVFDDFLACAEHLIAEGYTSPEHLAIAGGSNGGLLVGAALAQRPDLFRAVSCGCPLLDMVRYHQFLLAKLWVDEYGSSDDPDQFPYLLAYSPYHNVREGTRYPAVLFRTGDADTRVAPLHARKMCALLQAASASGLPVLLHYDEAVGHSGGRTVSQSVDDGTLEMSFLLWQIAATAD